MAKYVGYKRPKDTKKTVKHLLSYLGHYKWAFLLIAILVFISAGAGIMGTFLIKPVVNNFIVPGKYEGAYHCCVRNGCHVCVRCALNAWLQQAYGAYFPEGSKRDSNGPF